MANDNMFTDEENAVLQRNMDRRELMLQFMFDEGKSPEKSGDMRVAKEIIESLDSMMLTRAKMRSDVSSEEQDREIKKLALETMRLNRLQAVNSDDESSKPDNVDITIPTDIVDGENDLVQDTLLIGDFVKKRKE